MIECCEPATKIRTNLPWAALKAALHAVMNADNRPKARSAARRLADQWQEIYQKPSPA